MWWPQKLIFAAVLCTAYGAPGNRNIQKSTEAPLKQAIQALPIQKQHLIPPSCLNDSIHLSDLCIIIIDYVFQGQNYTQEVPNDSSFQCPLNLSPLAKFKNIIKIDALAYYGDKKNCTSSCQNNKLCPIVNSLNNWLKLNQTDQPNDDHTKKNVAIAPDTRINVPDTPTNLEDQNKQAPIVGNPISNTPPAVQIPAVQSPVVQHTAVQPPEVQSPADPLPDDHLHLVHLPEVSPPAIRQPAVPSPPTRNPKVENRGSIVDEQKDVSPDQQQIQIQESDVNHQKFGDEEDEDDLPEIENPEIPLAEPEDAEVADGEKPPQPPPAIKLKDVTDVSHIESNGPFQDTPDSHLFFYFLSFVSISAVGYVAFHNKNKIFALLLEGRRGRQGRRRPSTSGYRKLDTSLEEAMMSHPSRGPATQVIY